MNDKLLTGITGLLFVLGIGCIIYVVIGNFSQEMKVQDYGNLSCVKRTAVMTNTEEPMAGVIPLNERIKVLHNYYSCNKVSYKDLVLFQFSKSIPPVIRIAYGLPGDKFKVTQDTGDTSLWHVDIGGKKVAGSTGPYVIKCKNIPPLKTYEISRKGILGKDEYIIFADSSPSISDSSNLGIVKTATLVGRAFPMDEAPAN